MLSRKKNTSAVNSTTTNSELYSQLFNEIVELAIEENMHKSVALFVSFIYEMLPQEIILYLEDIFPSGSTFLEDYWTERFEEDSDSCVRKEEDNTEALFCEICDRMVKLTKHHVYPKETHRACLKRGLSDEQELMKVILICRMCHSTVHRFFSNDELSKHFFTLELLLEDAKIQKYQMWASSQSAFRNSRVR